MNTNEVLHSINQVDCLMMKYTKNITDVIKSHCPIEFEKSIGIFTNDEYGYEYIQKVTVNKHGWVILHTDMGKKIPFNSFDWNSVKEFFVRISDILIDLENKMGS